MAGIFPAAAAAGATAGTTAFAVLPIPDSSDYNSKKQHCYNCSNYKCWPIHGTAS